MVLCRACGTELKPFMSFGEMPLANGFLTIDQIPKEAFYELAPAVCPTCSLFQIMEQPMPDRMFHSQYPYYTSNSLRMQKHFGEFAEKVKKLKPGGSVIELGCNDGTMLQHLPGGLGIEPAKNVADIAIERGCFVINRFFDHRLAKDLANKVDAIIGANVVCHIADLPDLIAGVRLVLKPDGLFIFEEPYLPSMMRRCSFDQIYDEHVFLFSATSVSSAFAQHGMFLFDAEWQWAHGGSMRYYLSPHIQSPTKQLWQILANEFQYGLQDAQTYVNLRKHIKNKRDALLNKVVDLRDRGKRIVGYGATSKSTTVTVYCGLGPTDIEYISDTTPIKQGKVSPGAHIPIKPYSEFVADPPDVALLFAWNHAEEIYAKEKAFKGQWLNYVPEVVLS